MNEKVKIGDVITVYNRSALVTAVEVKENYFTYPKAEIIHARFIEKPNPGAGDGTFSMVRAVKD